MAWHVILQCAAQSFCAIVIVIVMSLSATTAVVVGGEKDSLNNTRNEDSLSSATAVAMVSVLRHIFSSWQREPYHSFNCPSPTITLCYITLLWTSFLSMHPPAEEEEARADSPQQPVTICNGWHGIHTYIATTFCDIFCVCWRFKGMPPITATKNCGWVVVGRRRKSDANVFWQLFSTVVVVLGIKDEEKNGEQVQCNNNNWYADLTGPYRVRRHPPPLQPLWGWWLQLSPLTDDHCMSVCRQEMVTLHFHYNTNALSAYNGTWRWCPRGWMTCFPGCRSNDSWPYFNSLATGTLYGYCPEQSQERRFGS